MEEELRRTQDELKRAQEEIIRLTTNSINLEQENKSIIEKAQRNEDKLLIMIGKLTADYIIK